MPSRVIFDNAAGVGRKRRWDDVRTPELFGRMAAHYCFACSFCNPESGHEKGHVESKVGTVRRPLFVPQPVVYDVRAFNAKLLDRCMALSDKAHYRKGARELDLFDDDRDAMSGLPAAPFRPVVWRRAKAGKQGNVRLEGPHWYAAGPQMASRELTCGLTAREVATYGPGGEELCRHERAYGDAPTTSWDPASQIPLLIFRTEGWLNSQVRASLPDSVRGHMDSLPRQELRQELRALHAQAEASGWLATATAAERCVAACGRIDEGSLFALDAARGSVPVLYDEPVDLSVYDGAFREGR